MGVPILSTFLGRCADWGVDRLFPPARLGVLTAPTVVPESPRSIPDPTVIGRHPGPAPGCPPPVGAPAVPHTPRRDAWTGRIRAWDCLFSDIETHKCVDKFGAWFRPGGSCHASAELMGRKSFAAKYPGLHAKAVLLGIIEDGQVS